MLKEKRKIPLKGTGKQDKKHDDQVEQVKRLLEKEIMKHSVLNTWDMKSILKTNDNSGKVSSLSETDHPTPYTPYTITVNDSTTKLLSYFTDYKNADPNSSQDTDTKTDIDTKQATLNKRYVQLLFDTWTAFKPEWEKQVDKIIKELVKNNVTASGELDLSHFKMTGLATDEENFPKQKMAFPFIFIGAHLFRFIATTVARAVVRKVAENVVKKVAENVGKNIIQDVGKNIIKETGKKFIKDAGKNIGKETGKKIGKETGKKVGKETGKKAGKNKNRPKRPKKNQKKKKRKSKENSMPEDDSEVSYYSDPDEQDSQESDEADSQESDEADSQELDEADRQESHVPISADLGAQHLKLITNDGMDLNSKGLFEQLGPMFGGSGSTSHEKTIVPDDSQDNDPTEEKLKKWKPPKPRITKPTKKPTTKKPNTQKTKPTTPTSSTKKPTTKKTEPTTISTETSTTTKKETEEGSNNDVNVNIDHTFNIVDATTNSDNKHDAQDSDTSDEYKKSSITSPWLPQTPQDTAISGESQETPKTSPWLPQTPQDTAISGESQETLITSPWLPQTPQDTSVETPGSKQNLKLEINDKGLFEQLGPMFGGSSSTSHEITIVPDESQDNDPTEEKLKKWKIPKVTKPRTKTPKTKKPKTTKPKKTKATTPTTIEPSKTSTEKEKETSGSNDDIEQQNPDPPSKLKKKIAVNKKQLRSKSRSKRVFRNGTMPSYSEKSDKNKKSQDSSDYDGNADINLKRLDSASYDELVNKYDKNEYQADCPKQCPIRNVPVCAKCKDGIYRTFLSVCHMRAFHCKHPEEELELVSRYSCVLSAPYYNDGLPIQGTVAEPNDEDPVLKYMKLKSDHQAIKDNPFAADGHHHVLHKLNIY